MARRKSSVPSPATTVVVAPQNRRAASASARDGEVTPDLYRRALRAARGGEPAALFGILDHFLQMDDEIPAALESLISAALTDGIVIVPTDESDEGAHQAEIGQAMFDALDAGSLGEELLHAHYYGVRAAAPGWDAWGYGGRTYQAPTAYDLLPNEWIYAQRAEGSATTQLHVGREPVAAYAPGAVVVMTQKDLPHSVDVDFRRLGKGLAAARFGIFAWFNIEDWAGYNEVLGVPTVLGTLLDGWGKADREFLEAAVYGITSDARAIKTSRTNIELLERKVDGTTLYQEFLSAMSSIRSKVIKGESLTEGPRGQGSFAAAKTSNGIRVDVADRLTTRGAKVLTRSLLDPFCQLNFGKRLCRVQWNVRPAADPLAESRVDEALNRMGVPLSLTDLRRRYGRPSPTDEADTLRVVRPAFDPFGGG